MKIIYLHQYFKFPDQSGGTRSYDLAKSFVEQGYSVCVVSASSDNIYKNSSRWTCINRDGIEVHYTYLPYGNHLNYLQRTIVFIKFLCIASLKLLKLNGDVVLATSTPLTIGIPALIKKWFGNTPFIFEVRDVWPEAVIAIGAIKNKFVQKMLHCLEKLIYKNAAAIVPLSIDMKTSIITRFPNFTDKTAIVIENISEITRFQNCNDTISLADVIGFEPRFSVLYAGTFGKVNGIDKFVTLAKLTLSIDPSLVFILIGSGAEKVNISDLAAEAQVLNRNLFILDPVTKNELPSWYKSVSIGSSFVIDIPELWANSANKFFDTLAAGKPILINHEGWQAKTLQSNNCGYVLPAVIDYNAALDFVNYSNSTTLIREQCSNSLLLAKKCFSLDVASTKYIKILNKFKKTDNHV